MSKISKKFREEAQRRYDLGYREGSTVGEQMCEEIEALEAKLEFIRELVREDEELLYSPADGAHTHFLRSSKLEDVLKVRDIEHPEVYDKENKAEVFEVLREQILAARIRLVIDKQNGVESAKHTQKLARMVLPPMRKTWNK